MWRVPSALNWHKLKALPPDYAGSHSVRPFTKTHYLNHSITPTMAVLWAIQGSNLVNLSLELNLCLARIPYLGCQSNLLRQEILRREVRQNIPRCLSGIQNDTLRQSGLKVNEQNQQSRSILSAFLLWRITVSPPGQCQRVQRHLKHTICGWQFIY